MSNPARLEQLIQRDLLPDESLHWVGQPDPSVLFSQADIYLIPFSLLWGGFAIFWETMVITSMIHQPAGSPIGIILPLFGIPFVLLGLYFIAGRFLVKRLRRRHTCYAVTSKRLIIKQTLGQGSLESIYLTDIPAITESYRADGSGTIRFGSGSGSTIYGDDSGMEFFSSIRGYSPAPTFRDIPNAREVIMLIRSLKEKTNS